MYRITVVHELDEVESENYKDPNSTMSKEEFIVSEIKGRIGDKNSPMWMREEQIIP